MLSTYNASEQALNQNEDLVFAQNKILTSCSTQHVENSSTIKLTSPGYYYVSFDAIATAQEEDETVPITVSLYKNDVLVPGSTASSLSTGTANEVSLSFSTIVKVYPSCCIVDNDANLVFVNTGTPATFTNTNVNVWRII